MWVVILLFARSKHHLENYSTIVIINIIMLFLSYILCVCIKLHALFYNFYDIKYIRPPLHCYTPWWATAPAWGTVIIASVDLGIDRQHCENNHSEYDTSLSRMIKYNIKLRVMSCWQKAGARRTDNFKIAISLNSPLQMNTMLLIDINIAIVIFVFCY